MPSTVKGVVARGKGAPVAVETSSSPTRVRARRS